MIASEFSGDGFREYSSAERQQLAGQWYLQSESGLDIRSRIDLSRDPLTQDPQGITLEQWQQDPEQVHPVAAIFKPRKSIDHKQWSLSAGKDESWGRWQGAAWLGEREINQFLSFPGDDLYSGGAVIDLDRQFAGISAKIERQFGALEWLVGTELGQMRDDRRGYVNNRGEQGELKRDEIGTVTNTDIFTSITWPVTDAWLVRAGSRFSRVDFEVEDHFINTVNPDDSGQLLYQEPSYFAGVSYGAERWSLFANLGSGFEAPTLTELAYRNSGTGLNRDLVAARNQQAELGWRLDGVRWQSSLVAFVVHSDDELVVDQSDGGRTTYRNAAQTERAGFEWSFDTEVMPGLDWRLAASWLDAEYSAGPYAGNQLPGVASENAYSQWDWQPWGEGISVSLTSRYRSGVMTTDDNSERVPSAILWDAALQTDWQRAAWRMDIWLKYANLADKHTVGSVIVNQSRGRTIEPAPGRQFDLGVRLSRQW